MNALLNIMPRGLILALGFLTRIPMPALPDFREEELSDSARWFPLVGLFIGLLLLLMVELGGNHPLLAALLVLLIWVGITGGLHLDGAADLADALGAAHRDPERLLAVMKDPHTGSFGVIAIASIVLTKLITVAVIVESDISLWSLLLIPAWGRLGAIFWSQTLPALAPGSGERFKWEVADKVLLFWGGVLFVVTWLQVTLLFAFVCVAALLMWRTYLQWRLGGMSGDCLGAGIEYSECIMLMAVALLC